jgi:hypothetical protein
MSTAEKKTRARNLIDGMTVDQAADHIYAIAERNRYTSKTDKYLERSIGRDWPQMQPVDLNWIRTVLIPRHGSASVKIGPGIANVAFGMNTRFAFRTAKRVPCCMYVLRIDGTISDVSWRECLSPSKTRYKVMNALRNAIRPQIAEIKFDIAGKESCMLCGENVAGREYDLDHFPWTFVELAETWSQSIGVKVESIATHGEDDLQVGDTLTCPVQLQSWQDYHREHAALRVLCRNCHKSAGKKA